MLFLSSAVDLSYRTLVEKDPQGHGNINLAVLDLQTSLGVNLWKRWVRIDNY